MRWYAILFWAWVIGSLVVLVWRRVNRSDATEEDPAVEPPSAAAKVWGPPPPEQAGTSDPATGPESSAPSLPPQEHAPPPAAPPAPAAPPPAPHSQGATLADLLSGITLPLGLVPLTQSSTAGTPTTSIVVATDSAGPEQVGTALADAIEELGYTVRTTGEHTARAEGPRGTVEIEIHPDASTVTDGGQRRFPTASETSVVVELRVGSDASGR